MGVWGWGGGWGKRTLGMFVKSFLHALREKQHRNIFSHHRSACKVWVDSDIHRISLEIAIMRLLPAAINSLCVS